MGQTTKFPLNQLRRGNKCSNGYTFSEGRSPAPSLGGSCGAPAPLLSPALRRPGPFPPGHVAAAAALPRRVPPALPMALPHRSVSYLPAGARNPKLHVQATLPSRGDNSPILPAPRAWAKERGSTGRSHKPPRASPAHPRALEAVCAAPDPGCRPSVESDKRAPLSRICVLSNLCATREYLMFAMVYFFLCEYRGRRELRLPIPEAFAWARRPAQALWANARGGLWGAEWEAQGDCAWWGGHLVLVVRKIRPQKNLNSYSTRSTVNWNTFSEARWCSI